MFGNIGWKIAHFPLFLTLFRTRDKPLYILKHISAEQILFFPALYFLLKPLDFLLFTFQYVFLFVLCWTFYEIDYLVNDFIAVRYEDFPYYRDYAKHINFTVALVIRVVFLVFSVFLLQFNSYFLLWMFILGMYFAVLNILKTKKSRIPIYSCTRTLRALFVPLIMSRFSFSVIYVCLVLYLPILLADSRSTVIGITERYLNLPRGKMGLDTTYFEVILKLLPLQIFFLLSYPLTIFLGELLLALISLLGKGNESNRSGYR